MRRTQLSTFTAAWAILYAGILIGVSFVAVPAKFLAESVTLAQQLDVGRHEFQVFGWVEAVCALTLAGVGFRAGGKWRRWLPVIVLALVVLQHLGLRPPLDQRVGMILDGKDLPDSSLHTLYGVLEILKLVLLLSIGVLFGRARQGRARVATLAEL